jgi:serine/threonine protein kinase
LKPTDASSFDALLGALARAPEQSLAKPRELAPGTHVGRYVLDRLLGKGAMGAVYRARDTLLGRDVALKLLFVDALAGAVDRFRREVVALASVSHENVVSVYDAGTDGSQPFVVLELVEGITLRERLRDGALPPADAAALAQQLARGLAAAHAVGVVHRDLKPENVLLDARGTAKLVDFGLASVVEPASGDAAARTETGVLLGTAHYMAPEQVRGERVDHRADYFALGAVLYELLTGRRAFSGASRADIISAVLRDQPRTEVALLTDETSRNLLGAALRCLEKDPARRFQTGVELLDALTGASPAPPLPPGDADLPPTRYATSSGVHIAYQVVSPKGPPTLLATAPFISNIEVMWESPADRAWLRTLGSFSHFIHFDRRGVGMSDPVAPECSLDERAEDLRAVLDAERVHSAFLLGVSEGGPTSITFAAKYPERVKGLVLLNSFARLVKADGYPHGSTREEYQGLIDKWVERWATPQTLTARLFVQSRAGDPEFVRWGNRYERQCASPGTVRRLLELQFDMDVRPLLPKLRCPVLILHRRSDPTILVEHGRYLAEHLPHARYVECEGVDHAPWYGDAQHELELIRLFVAQPTAS